MPSRYLSSTLYLDVSLVILLKDSVNFRIIFIRGAQCDQIVRISVHILAIQNIKNMPNSIKTNILNQNFAHYNNKDTLKLPNYFFKGHRGKISPNLVTLEVRTPKFNIKIHLRGGQPLTTFLKNYILQFSGTRWRDYFFNICPFVTRKFYPMT